MSADLPWLTPQRFYTTMLGQRPLNRTSYADTIARLSASKLERIGAHLVEGAKASFLDTMRAQFDLLIRGLETEASTEIYRAGADGLWLATGRPSPDAEPEPIPAWHWEHLRLDLETGTAASDKADLRFYNVRCLIVDDLTDDQKRALKTPAAAPVSVSTEHPIDLAAKKREFIAWAEAGKRQHKTYPPVARDKHGRDGWRNWAADEGVDRDVVKTWVSELGFNRPRGAPNKSAN